MKHCINGNGLKSKIACTRLIYTMYITYILVSIPIPWAELVLVSNRQVLNTA